MSDLHAQGIEERLKMCALKLMGDSESWLYNPKYAQSVGFAKKKGPKKDGNCIHFSMLECPVHL